MRGGASAAAPAGALRRWSLGLVTIRGSAPTITKTRSRSKGSDKGACNGRVNRSVTIAPVFRRAAARLGAVLAFRLIPREEKFYGDFQALADELSDADPGRAQVYAKNLQALGQRLVHDLNALRGVEYPSDPALAARIAGVPCSVMVIETAPQAKFNAIEKLGATIVRASYDECWRTVEAHASDRMRGYFIHPFDDDDFIAGNGTAGLEILEDLPDVDVVVAALGGGGLLVTTHDGLVDKGRPSPFVAELTDGAGPELTIVHRPGTRAEAAAGVEVRRDAHDRNVGALLRCAQRRRAG